MKVAFQRMTLDFSIGVLELLKNVGLCCNRRVFVWAVQAGDQSVVIWMKKERQRLTCAGVSDRGKQNPVTLQTGTMLTDTNAMQLLPKYNLLLIFVQKYFHIFK